MTYTQPIEVLSVLVSQIDYLFKVCQQEKSVDEDYHSMMSDKIAADCNMMKIQLQKSVSSFFSLQ